MITVKMLWLYLYLYFTKMHFFRMTAIALSFCDGFRNYVKSITLFFEFLLQKLHLAAGNNNWLYFPLLLFYCLETV